MSVDFPKGVSAFHVKIYQVVEDPSSDSMISWGKNNNSFVIWNMEALYSSGILHDFYCSKFSKFRSELKYYGFRKIKKHSSGDWEFGHEDFVRGQPERLKTMMLKTGRKHKAESAAKRVANDLQRLQM